MLIAINNQRWKQLLYLFQIYEDSDFETEVDPPDWRLSLSPEDLENLKPKEKKRQDVINGEFALWTKYKIIF